MKQAAMEAVESGQPADIRTGLVTNTEPLTIQITPQFILPASVLIVPKHLTDYTVKVSFNWETENAGQHNHGYSGNTASTSGGSGESAFSSHSHSYSGTTENTPDHKHVVKSEKDKEITIHNALQVNDKVALLRQKGGQFYYILDRI